MLYSVLTIFPDLLSSPLEEGIISRARKSKKIEVEITNIRAFAYDKHATTDDRPFGGGEGMVMKPEPLAAAVTHVGNRHPGEKRIILLTPQGRLFTQETARRLSRMRHLVLVCGRYEGVDDRFTESYIDEEISIGDYILTGGELAALAIIDSVTRLIPGVLGCSDSADNDSFSRNLLKHPQYTRPRTFENQDVPQELLTGDHEKIADFRFIASIRRTLERRPELLVGASFNKREKKLLKDYGYDQAIHTIKSRG